MSRNGETRSRGLTSLASPMKEINLSWVPDGMDRTSACRITIRVGAYWEKDRYEYHVSQNIRWIRDKDTVCWMDLHAELYDELKLGTGQRLSVTYWDKNESKYNEITCDSTLLAAFNMYWEIGKLPLNVIVIDEPCSDTQTSALATTQQCDVGGDFIVTRRAKPIQMQMPLIMMQILRSLMQIAQLQVLLTMQILLNL